MPARSHGESRAPEYAAWRDMMRRCFDEKHRSWTNYGGRGITVCAEWSAYSAFLAAVGRRPSRHHSLDRVDNSGNYEPGNVRWATLAEQHRNTRRTHFIEFGGERLPMTDWARRFGIDPKSVYNGVRRHGVEKYFRRRIEAARVEVPYGDVGPWDARDSLVGEP
jgi:hypothetical protein